MPTPRRHALLAEVPPVHAALPVVAAALVALAIGAGARASGLPAARSLVFALVPAALLVTLHVRTSGFLHDDQLAATLPLPIAPARRFGLAAARHARGLAAAMLWLLGGIALGAAPLGLGAPALCGLLLDALAVGVASLATEPFGAAVAARLGRRQPPGSWAEQLQHKLGGGWTLPEAVVHLYAPAGSLGLAGLLALPVQLAIDRAVDGHALLVGLGAAMLLAAAIAVGLRLAAPVLYRGGVFEAVPWLREAMRTLAGPPVPERASRWIAAVADPALRLVLLQHERLTPAPRLRLVLLLATAVVLALRGTPLSAGEVGLALALCALWLVPAAALLRHGAVRRAALAALPVRSPTTRARALLAAPVAVMLASIAIRVLRGEA
ncbi:MAG: hypothetical protein K1X88_15425 [Nannocystaceae bacterium]|nr:hypothetical protein [Nannocystaceae bacterium]